MLEKLLARSIFKVEWKKLGLWVLFSFFVVSISLCTVVKPYMDPLPLWKIHFKRLITTTYKDSDDVFLHGIFEPFLAPMCDFSGEKSDFCELDGDIRIKGNVSSIFFTSPQLPNIELQNNTWNIKLYARKTDKYVMGKVKDLLLKPVSHVQEMPECTVNHSLPTILFSSGGYAGNIFHDTSDVFIPLYLTSLHFNGEVQFLLQEKHSWWTKKYEVMLNALSNYEIIDLNRDKETRCFKNAIVGVRSHKDFGIDPKKFPYGLTLRNFTQFIRKIYSLERETVKEDRKPRLLILSRKKTRSILNEDEIAMEAQNLGFDVEVIDARMNLMNFSKIVNSIDVMIGVHGAGLTNMIYLPENAVLIQVIPLGLDSVSKIFYERPATNMNLKYLNYKVSVNESSLIQQYPIKHRIIINPDLVKKEGWHNFKRIYMDNQDVTLDITKFKLVLSQSLELLRQ